MIHIICEIRRFFNFLEIGARKYFNSIHIDNQFKKFFMDFENRNFN